MTSMELPGFFRFKQKFYILEKKCTIHFWIQESEFAFCQKKPSLAYTRAPYCDWSPCVSNNEF